MRPREDILCSFSWNNSRKSERWSEIEVDRETNIESACERGGRVREEGVKETEYLTGIFLK